MTNEKQLVAANGKEIFRVEPNSYIKNTILISLIFMSLISIISAFFIIIAILLVNYPSNIIYISVSLFLIIGGIYIFIISLTQAYTQYLITSESIISIPTKLLKKKQKKIELKNIAFVINWNDGLEIAEKNEKTATMYQETLKKFKVPMIRRYIYIKLHLINKNKKEQNLKNEILEYLIEQLNLVKHPNLDSIYLSK